MAKKASQSPNVGSPPGSFWTGGAGVPPPAPQVGAGHGSEDWEGALNKLVAEKAAHVTALGNPALTNLAGAENEPWGKENFLFALVAQKNNTGERAIKVVVREKTNAVTDEAFIPAQIDHDGQSYVTDVEQGSVFLLQGPPPPMAFAAQTPPFFGGYSISLQSENAAGTLGCIVQLEDGRLCLLSNNHVIGKGNLASVDTDIVVAPGQLDASMLNLPSAQIARLAKIHPINFSGMVNTVDAAIAHLKENMVRVEFFGWQGPLNPDYIVEPTEGMVVKKAGRTTGFTVGMIRSTLGVIPNLGYGPGVDNKPRFALFRQQLVIEGVGGAFSDRGDSGSLVVEAASNKPVGLLFAGGQTDNGSNYTFANPIVDVKQALAIHRFVDAF